MRIIIDGPPVAQTRMKYSARNGIGRIYDPKEKEKRLIKAQIAIRNIDRPVLENPRVSFVFHMPIPKTLPKRMWGLYKSGLFKHKKKPDVDNFIKLYLDCMDGICFDGDQKVTLGPCVKLYHPHPKTIIIINSVDEVLSPLEVDPMTWFFLFSKESGGCSTLEMASLPDSYTPDLLEYQQYFGTTYPSQKIPTCDSIPLVPRVAG